MMPMSSPMMNRMLGFSAAIAELAIKANISAKSHKKRILVVFIFPSVCFVVP